MSIQHIIITRFNIEASFSKNKNFIDENWLDNRLEIFKQYCLPSIQHQTQKDFEWLIISHPKTPKKQANQLQDLISNLHNTQIVQLDIIQENKLLIYIQNHIKSKAKYLLTTRFDSDDAIHPRFVEVLMQNIQPSENRSIYNFPNGIILGNKRLYAYCNEANPFISLLEPVSDFLTVFHDQFRDIPKLGKLKQIKLPNAFVQVVHNSNVWNRINGYWLGKELLAQYSWINVNVEQPNFWQKIVNQARFAKKKTRLKSST